MGAAAVTPAGQALVAELSTESDAQPGLRLADDRAVRRSGGRSGAGLASLHLGRRARASGRSTRSSCSAVRSRPLTAVALLFAIKEPEHAAAPAGQGGSTRHTGGWSPGRCSPSWCVAATGHFAMGVFEVLWSLWLRHLGASMRFIGLTWMAFSVPMLLAWVGGYLADRYSRWALMFSGYTVSAYRLDLYGTTRNLTLFLVVNIVEGLAVAWSYPAKQGVPGAGGRRPVGWVACRAWSRPSCRWRLWSAHWWLRCCTGIFRLRDQPGRGGIADGCYSCGAHTLSGVGGRAGAGRRSARGENPLRFHDRGFVRYNRWL